MLCESNDKKRKKRFDGIALLMRYALDYQNRDAKTILFGSEIRLGYIIRVPGGIIRYSPTVIYRSGFNGFSDILRYRPMHLITSVQRNAGFRCRCFIVGWLIEPVH